MEKVAIDKRTASKPYKKANRKVGAFVLLSGLLCALLLRDYTIDNCASWLACKLPAIGSGEHRNKMQNKWKKHAVRFTYWIIHT